MYSKILVPIDGSEPSKIALDEALRLAVATKAAVRLVHVVEPGIYLGLDTTAAGYPVLLESLRRDGEQLLRDAAAPFSHAGIQVDTVLADALDLPVGKCIVDAAGEYGAELIISGTHGRRGLRRVLMGSDAEYVVRNTSIPVLLVRPDEAARVQDRSTGAAA